MDSLVMQHQLKLLMDYSKILPKWKGGTEWGGSPFRPVSCIRCRKTMKYAFFMGRHRKICVPLIDELGDVLDTHTKLIKALVHYSLYNDLYIQKPSKKGLQRLLDITKEIKDLSKLRYYEIRCKKPRNSKYTYSNTDKVQCEHCDKIISPNNHLRWHGDKCKLKK